MEQPLICVLKCRYQVGSVVTDNPEEEKRQKELKSLLNRVTPEKYDTIKARILGVGLQSAVTMQGFVCQVSLCQSTAHSWR